MNKEEWQNRKMTTRVLTHCEYCKTLQEKVEKRSWTNYAWSSNRRMVDMVSCEGCFDKEVELQKKRPNDPSLDMYGY